MLKFVPELEAAGRPTASVLRDRGGIPAVVDDVVRSTNSDRTLRLRLKLLPGPSIQAASPLKDLPHPVLSAVFGGEIDRRDRLTAEGLPLSIAKGDTRVANRRLPNRPSD